MLIELRIRNYAVAEDLSLRLGDGLTALTGETGAGKSIIVGALSLLLGERASTEVVRASADRAVVEAVFDISHLPEVLNRLDEGGFPDEGGLLILRREVAREGRNRAWVNGSPATAGIVGELGRFLVDLHGQHDHQSLLRSGEQRDILDAYARAPKAASQVAEVYAETAGAREALETLDQRRRELEGRRDFLAFQLKEIDAVSPEDGEDERLEQEVRILEHGEDLAVGTGGLYSALYGGEEALSDQLAGFVEELKRLTRYDPALEPELKTLEEAYHDVAEVGRRLADYQASVEQDPERLEEIRARLDALSRLKRKFGPIPEARALRESLATELDELDSGALDRGRLEKRLRTLEAELDQGARRLSDLRAEGARKLEGEVREILPDLGLSGGTFEVRLEPQPEITSHGAERVEFVVSLNPGFPPAPLARIASGGELARVMLALKTVLARLDRVPTLVFDEIDAGIGGTVAGAVAERLAEVATEHQVFVVTHLPQVASRAGSHLRVHKGLTPDGLASTGVVALTGEERVEEVARMLGGDPESARSREHAREMLLGTA
jgi:DNA repair protein RecN (Recombination protein N)